MRNFSVGYAARLLRKTLEAWWRSPPANRSRMAPRLGTRYAYQWSRPMRLNESAGKSGWACASSRRVWLLLPSAPSSRSKGRSPSRASRQTLFWKSMASTCASKWIGMPAACTCSYSLATTWFRQWEYTPSRTEVKESSRPRTRWWMTTPKNSDRSARMASQMPICCRMRMEAGEKTIGKVKPCACRKSSSCAPFEQGDLLEMLLEQQRSDHAHRPRSNDDQVLMSCCAPFIGSRS